MRRLSAVFSVCTLLAFNPERGDAQFVSNWTPSATDCQRAADSLTAGSRNREAWGFIADCGTTGTTAIAGAIRTVRLTAVQDTAYLTDLLTVASAVQEPSVLNEAIALAEAKPASAAARIFGLMVMLAQHQPATVIMGRGGWSELLTKPWGSHCPFLSATHMTYKATVAMPTDFRHTIATSVDRIAGDPTDGSIMRGLAGCIRLALRPWVPETVAPELLRLEHVCGTKFRVKNSAAKPASVRYEVVGTTETGDLTVAADGFAQFMTASVGTVRLLQNSAVVASAANPATPCP